MQKAIKINLNNDRILYPAGYIGEVNHRALEIVPPTDLKKSAYYKIAFEVNGGLLYHPGDFPGGTPILAGLAPPVTLQPETDMTLEGYSEDGTLLGKSHKVTLSFLRAVQGPAMDFTGPPGPGVPAGGAAGQLLAKASAADFDTAWVDPLEGGGGGSGEEFTVEMALAALNGEEI